MQIAQWIDEFELYLVAAKRRPNTVRQYRVQLGGFAEYMHGLGIDRPEQITRSAFRHWAADMSERWKDSTLRQAIIMVNNFLRFVSNEGVSMQNLDGAVLLPRVRDVPQRTLSVDEIKQILGFIESLKDSPLKHRSRALISLMIDSGLRASEVCNLRTENLNLEKGVLLIEGKGGDWARGFFGTRTAGALRKWLTVREDLLRLWRKDDPGTVFISIGGKTKGSPLTADGLRSIVSKIGKAAGVEKASPHAYRRSFATYSVLHEMVPTRVVQVMGRWNSLLMVEKYTKVLDDLEAVDAQHFVQYAPLDKMLGDDGNYSKEPERR